MTQIRELPISKSTIRATSSVLNLLPQIAGLVVGFSCLAYVAGWREASSYYQELGAPWALLILSPSQIMQTSIWLISMISLISFLSVLSLVQGNAGQEGLRRWSYIFLLLAAVTYILPMALESRVSNSVIRFFAGATSVFWAISAGLTIGELIACLALDSLKWGEYHVFLLYFIVFYGFFQAPSNMGTTLAKLAGDSDSPLPKVSFSSTGQTGKWRLVGPCGDKLLLVSLGERKDRRFKLVAPEAIEEIYAFGTR